MRLKRISLLLLALPLIVEGVSAQSKYNERAVDSVCTVYALLHDFDGVILVSDGEKAVFQGAFGLANHQSREFVQLNTQFCITDLTHLFTATMVLKLIEDGDLYFDETVDIFFPKEKIPGKKFITIENLLTYSSGLPNDLDFMEKNVTEHHPEAYIKDLGEKKLQTPPGEESDLKNIDYILLGLVVERIMGKPWDDCLKELILDPCAMAETGVLKGADKSPQLAASYHVVDRPLMVEPDAPVRIDNYSSSGAIYSTIGDMFKFDRALYEGKVLSKNMLKMMLTNHPDFKNVALGWNVYQDKSGKKKLTIAQRSGHIQGYRAVWLRFVEDQRSIILLSNSDYVDLEDFSAQIQKQLYADTEVKKK
jgi:CubicO group peptidase (beta-lactamase class C family)